MSAAAYDSFLDDMQAEMAALPRADKVLGVLPVITERVGDIEQEVAKGLGLVTEVTGKLGACIVVKQIIGDDEGAAVPGGRMKGRGTYLVLEEPVLNDGASGHQLRALKICRRLVRIGKLYLAEGLASSLVTVGKGTITPVFAPMASVAYEVAFEFTEARILNFTKVMSPLLSVTTGAAPQTVTITCGTAGASIYYTLDGSHPWSGNANALLYAAPVNVAAAGMLRARAFHVDYDVGSNTSCGIFS